MAENKGDGETGGASLHGDGVVPDDPTTVVNPNAGRAGASRSVPSGSGDAPADHDDEHDRAALQPGYVLKEYRIERVLGVGGFGVSYLAHDTHLNTKVAIKEYLPGSSAYRDEASGTVHPKSSRDQEDYKTGLDRFLTEARTLAAFRHSNIVGVVRFFEANNTAYMVMNYELGESLGSWMAKRTARGEGAPDEAALVRMFVPLLQGLQKVHEAGFLHRDIKPANIYVRDSDGSLVLLDFGAARLASGALSEDGLTSIVTPGYAPFEQYHTHGRQGPWSDIYALGGVLYWFVVGRKPIEAAARIRHDPQESAQEAARGRYSAKFLEAIDWAMTPDDQARPQTVEEFLPVLIGNHPVNLRPGTPPAAPRAAARVPRKGVRRDKRLWAALAAGVVVVALAAGWYLHAQRGAAGAPLRLALQTGAVAQSQADASEWVASLTQLNTALSVPLGRPVEAVQVKDFAGELADGKPAYDLYLAPLDKMGAPVRVLHLTPVARFRDFSVSFLVKASSSLAKLADLEGHSAAVYPADSSHGPIMIHWLQVNDIKLDKVKFLTSNSPDAMVDALLYGKVDAVALPLYGAEEALAHYGDKLRVLSKSEAYPGFILAVAPQLPRERVVALEQTLLGLHATPEGAAVLGSVRIRQAAGTAELSRIMAAEVVTAADRLDRARKLYPADVATLEAKVAK